MPLDRKALLDTAEGDVTNYLQARPSQIETDLASTDAAVKRSRVASGDDINSVLKSVGERYNISPDIIGAALPTAQRGNEDLQASNQDALAIRKQKEAKGALNATINFAFQRLTSAGMDEKSARQAAIQYALDSQRRETTATTNAKARTNARDKQDSLDIYAQKRLELQNKYAQDKQRSAIFNSIVRSFAGLAGAGVGFAVGGPVGAAAGASLAGSAATNIDIGKSSSTPLRTESTFSTNIDPNTGRRI